MTMAAKRVGRVDWGSYATVTAGLTPSSVHCRIEDPRVEHHLVTSFSQEGTEGQERVDEIYYENTESKV